MGWTQACSLTCFLEGLCSFISPYELSTCYLLSFGLWTSYLGLCVRLWISMDFGIPKYGWDYIVLYHEWYGFLSPYLNLILLCLSHICKCFLYLVVWKSSIPRCLCICIQMQITYMHTSRGSFFSMLLKHVAINYLELYCKSLCCHLTPKRGRLKEHFPTLMVLCVS